MNTEEILNYIYKKRDSKPKLGLERIKKLLEFLGNPQKDLKFIHIAGTNGKGSTTSMIANVLKLAGYRVGKFISPYIIDFGERIQVNDRFISNEDVTRIISKMKDKIFEMEKSGEAPSSFEIITAIAFIYYKEQNCDIVCLEVGMGGRFDATNIIESPLVSVITIIDYDHMSYLGNSIDKIAFEKCGIIKSSCDVVSYPLQKEVAKDVIIQQCNLKECNLIFPKLDILEDINNTNQLYSFVYNKTKYNLSLAGKHQIYNAITAIECINVLIKKGYNINKENIVKGINTTTFPARLEVVNKSPLVIIDGSHNISGAHTVKDYITNITCDNLVGIIGMIEQKPYEEFLKILAPLFSKIIIVPVVKTNTQLNKEEENKLIKSQYNIAMKYNSNVEIETNYCVAYNKAKNYTNVNGIIVTGSLYLASDFRKITQNDY